jgi:hypothetical protein
VAARGRDFDDRRKFLTVHSDVQDDNVGRVIDLKLNPVGARFLDKHRMFGIGGAHPANVGGGQVLRGLASGGSGGYSGRYHPGCQNAGANGKSAMPKC